MRRWVGMLVVVMSCTEAPPPPPLLAPRPAPPPEVEPRPAEPLPELPEPPDAVVAFPDEVKLEEVGSDEQLLRLLLADPAAAERALHLLAAPDAWQVSVLAGFATARGEKSFEVTKDPTLPTLALEGVEVAGPGPAWLREEAALRGGKVPVTLPLNLPVEVVRLSGDDAELSVQLARAAVYGPTGHAPVKVLSTPVTGRVKRALLVGAPLQPEAVLLAARSQADDEAGRLLAVAWWRRAWQLERSERTREGLLRAAWAARRASTVVQAALARNLAPGRSLRLASACSTDDVSAAKWVDAGKRPPKTPPPATCLSGTPPRSPCPDDPSAEAGSLPWLRFVVDARAPRQAFVVATPLELVEPCNDFEELTFEAGSGQVRRLALPLGTQALEVFVPGSRRAGVDYSVINATTEARAISFLRSRGRYKWTIGRAGELQPSLGVDALGFDVPRDVNATSFAVLPPRACSCD